MTRKEAQTHITIGTQWQRKDPLPPSCGEGVNRVFEITRVDEKEISYGYPQGSPGLYAGRADIKSMVERIASGKYQIIRSGNPKGKKRMPELLVDASKLSVRFSPESPEHQGVSIRINAKRDTDYPTHVVLEATFHGKLGKQGSKKTPSEYEVAKIAIELLRRERAAILILDCPESRGSHNFQWGLPQDWETLSTCYNIPENLTHRDIPEAGRFLNWWKHQPETEWLKRRTPWELCFWETPTGISFFEALCMQGQATVLNPETIQELVKIRKYHPKNSEMEIIALLHGLIPKPSGCDSGKTGGSESIILSKKTEATFNKSDWQNSTAGSKFVALSTATRRVPANSSEKRELALEICKPHAGVIDVEQHGKKSKAYSVRQLDALLQILESSKGEQLMDYLGEAMKPLLEKTQCRTTYKGYRITPLLLMSAGANPLDPEILKRVAQYTSHLQNSGGSPVSPKEAKTWAWLAEQTRPEKIREVVEEKKQVEIRNQLHAITLNLLSKTSGRWQLAARHWQDNEDFAYALVQKKIQADAITQHQKNSVPDQRFKNASPGVPPLLIKTVEKILNGDLPKIPDPAVTCGAMTWDYQKNALQLFLDEIHRWIAEEI